MPVDDTLKKHHLHGASADIGDLSCNFQAWICLRNPPKTKKKIVIPKRPRKRKGENTKSPEKQTQATPNPKPQTKTPNPKIKNHLKQTQANCASRNLFLLAALTPPLSPSHMKAHRIPKFRCSSAWAVVLLLWWIFVCFVSFSKTKILSSSLQNVFIFCLDSIFSYILCFILFILFCNFRSI